MRSHLHEDNSLMVDAISDDLVLITSSGSELCNEVKSISQVKSAEITKPHYNFQDNYCPE